MSENMEDIFQKDEMKMGQPIAGCSANEILEQEAMFYFRDISDILMINSLAIKNHSDNIFKLGGNPYQIMGCRKMQNHWLIRMKVFSPYYRRYMMSKFRHLNLEWDTCTLMKEKGIFALSRVCDIIPFESHQIRHLAKRNANAKTEMGVWYDSDIGVYLLDMEIFEPWYSIFALNKKRPPKKSGVIMRKPPNSCLNTK